ncbi:MAG: SAM-dependent methyltransferase [Oscillatoriales cyanobacterium]|nr:MAG: SAM-dependent methyltransferase [Oscillatoriales cyanobacterium]
MVFQLAQVVPWGRSFADYVGMFGLTDEDLGRSVLDCAGGPASFNATMHRQGQRVISCDPIYQFSAEEIAQRIDETCPTIVAGLHENHDWFVWSEAIPTPEALGECRLAAMGEFLADFPQGAIEGRYLVAELPSLPFADRAFELAISSHLLFTYTAQLSLEFHQAAIAELLRVADEVRIFPLLTNFTTERSPYVQPAIDALTAQGFRVEIVPTVYEFQRGGNELLRVWRDRLG